MFVLIQTDMTDNTAAKVSRKRSAPASTGSSSKATTNASDLVSLTKAVTNLSKALEDMDRRTLELSQFGGNVLLEWHTKLDAARRAFLNEEEEMEQTRKKRRLDHELTIQAHGRDYAIKMIEEDGYSAVRAEDYTRTVDELAELRQKLTTLEHDVTSRVTAELTKDHDMAMERVSLTNEAKVAQLSEQNKLLNVQIIELKNTISDLRKDVQSTQEIIKTFAGKPTIVRTGADK